MPWKRNSQARRKTKKANTPKKQRQWREIANSSLSRGDDEATAIRKANGVLKKRSKKRGSRRS